jgi:hypothetical protein
MSAEHSRTPLSFRMARSEVEERVDLFQGNLDIANIPQHEHVLSLSFLGISGYISFLFLFLNSSKTC